MKNSEDFKRFYKTVGTGNIFFRCSLIGDDIDEVEGVDTQYDGLMISLNSYGEYNIESLTFTERWVEVFESNKQVEILANDLAYSTIKVKGTFLCRKVTESDMFTKLSILQSILSKYEKVLN